VFGVVLAAFLVINSVIAFFYYLRVVKTMWMDAARGRSRAAAGLQPVGVVSC
jgi:NADH:ubiquinone oxidoreductase subunit 2 (subunit N)